MAFASSPHFFRRRRCSRLSWRRNFHNFRYSETREISHSLSLPLFSARYITSLLVFRCCPSSLPSSPFPQFVFRLLPGAVSIFRVATNGNMEIESRSG